jgi:predicted RNase H-like HicB family nuclease
VPKLGGGWASKGACGLVCGMGYNCGVRFVAPQGKAMATFLEYMGAAMERADYEWSTDGVWYAHIPELKGLWATGDTKEEAEKELRSALEGWLHVNYWIAKTPLPKFGDIGLGQPPQKLE